MIILYHATLFINELFIFVRRRGNESFTAVPPGKSFYVVVFHQPMSSFSSCRRMEIFRNLS